MKRKKVLFTWYHPFNPQTGGVERVTDILSKEFVKRGSEIFYLNTKPINDNYNYPARSFNLPNSVIRSEENIKYYHTLLEQLQIDIVINQAGNFADSIFFLNVGDSSIKTISVLHSNPLLTYDTNYQQLLRLPNCFKDILSSCYRGARYFYDQYLYLKSRKSVIDFVCKNSTKVLTLSESFFSEVEMLTSHLSNVSAIANPNTYEHEPLNLSAKRKEILFVGRLEKTQKRPDRLLKIWREIQKDNKEWNLTIVGDGPAREHLESYVKKHNLERVSFEGFKDPKPYYERASILCMTSNFEGFPMVLCESIVHGTVPIAFNSFQSVKDVIVDGETGLLVKPFDLKEYKNKLEMLMKDKSKRDLIAEKGYEHVKQFSKENIVNKWNELFNKL